MLDINSTDNTNSEDTLGMDDKDIIRTMNTRMNQALLVGQTWRDIECKENYDVFDGNQWTEDDVARQNANAQPIVTVNVTKPRLEAIKGMAIQTNPRVNYTPRLVNPRDEGYQDIMNHGVAYIEQSTNAQLQYNDMFMDCLKCGIGVTDTVFDYNKPPHNGTFKVERIFPAFIFWDPGARAKNLVDAEWAVRLKVVDRRVIKQEYGVDYYDDIYSVALDARILQFFSTVLTVKDLGVIYEYQWRKKVPFYRIENPFRDLDQEKLVGLAISKGISDMDGIKMFVEMLTEQAKFYGEKFGFNPEQDQMFSVDEGKDYNGFKETIEFYGLETKKIKQFKYKYFRAIVTGDKVVKKSENYSQSGFSLKFMTGEFSETTQSYYGLMRAVKPIQRLLNQAVSDWKGWLETIPKGGVNIESDAVQDINAFVNTYTKAKYVTVFAPGALSGGKVIPKLATPMAQGLLEIIQWADDNIFQAMGLTPDMMGQTVSKEQNAAFLKMQLKQGTMALATYFNAREAYFKEQGALYIDCMRILAENSEGMLIKNVLGDSDTAEFRLLTDNIAPEYDIIIEEAPASPDEKQHTFEQLLELVKVDPKFLPLAMEYAPMDMQAKKQVEQLLQPPPPPQPDPATQALLQAETAYKMASAKKLEADAMRMMVEAKRDMALLETDRERSEAEIGLTRAREASELVKTMGLSEAAIIARREHLYPEMYNPKRNLNG